MAETKYTYSIENDFPNQAVCITRLFIEIGESAIATECLYALANEDNDVCDIYFVDALSFGDEAVLDGLVSIHDGMPMDIGGCQVAVGDVPDENSVIWLDKNSSFIYCKDSNRNNKWLSSNKHSFEYARKGAAKGMYLPLLGDLDSVDDTFMSGKSATITSVFCKSKSGNTSAQFEIRKNGNLLFEFAYDGSDDRRYINDELDFDIELDDEIQVYIKNVGTSVNNTYCKIEISWRYV